MENKELNLKNAIEQLYQMLKNREINPLGYFDNGGRFYLYDDELVNVREPSRAFPYSQLSAGRTKKFVAKIAEKYNVQNLEELISHFSKA